MPKLSVRDQEQLTQIIYQKISNFSFNEESQRFAKEGYNNKLTTIEEQYSNHQHEISILSGKCDLLRNKHEAIREKFNDVSPSAFYGSSDEYRGAYSYDLCKDKWKLRQSILPKIKAKIVSDVALHGLNKDCDPNLLIDNMCEKYSYLITETSSFKDSSMESLSIVS